MSCRESHADLFGGTVQDEGEAFDREEIDLQAAVDDADRNCRRGWTEL